MFTRVCPFAAAAVCTGMFKREVSATVAAREARQQSLRAVLAAPQAGPKVDPPVVAPPEARISSVRPAAADPVVSQIIQPGSAIAPPKHSAFDAASKAEKRWFNH